jgi:hypothetical protein
LKGADSCDALALELVESAADDAEKRALGDLNEGVKAPVPPPPSRARKQKLEASGLDAESAKPLGETADEAPAAETNGEALETSHPST